MANLFKDLVHLVGTITNLDGDEAMRALTSIKAELRKRQRLFGEHDVNHINQYHKLFKEGVATEPMPHLFIISDEFAELKSEQPDFYERACINGTYWTFVRYSFNTCDTKPSGVVDDQIWSNSKFKLALKVQDRQDSNEILKHQMQQTLHYQVVRIYKLVIMKFMNCSNLHGVEQHMTSKAIN